ncbi:GGDEF domain-containing protein [Orrella sp. 11846]|uniref:GGDEF domain-containing protein n=1 Tax=Orrella sp. 11846 TaxID=3409913 RepID=UPI003B58D82F
MTAQSFARDWLQISDSVEKSDLDTLYHLVKMHANDLASAFYDTLMQDPVAHEFLNHTKVHSHLHHSMQNWVIKMCDPAARDRLHEIYDEQIKIGDIHARMNVSVGLVLKGARLLKQTFAQHVFAGDLSVQERFNCLKVFNGLIDLSMEAMSAAYTTSVSEKARSSEAYRLFSLTENLATERERQRAALLDWESQFMFEAAIAQDVKRLPAIQKSEFGLWFRHKARHAFDGLNETQFINEALTEIDEECLPLLADPDLPLTERSSNIHRIRTMALNMQTQLSSLFNKSMEIESGKDVLTGLLNRRFLTSILTREVELSRKENKSFSLASIDIDHFKQINDEHGHETGDLLLVAFSQFLQKQCRGGDFIFRMGGEEFLILMADANLPQATIGMQRLLTALRNETFLLPNRKVLSITVSIGLSTYDGHPDYQRLLRQSDRALYQAKQNGRNQLITL